MTFVSFDTLEFRRRLIAAGYTDADADRAVEIVRDESGKAEHTREEARNAMAVRETASDARTRADRWANEIFLLCAIGGFLLGGAIVQAIWWAKQADLSDREMAQLLDRAAAAVKTPGGLTDDARDALAKELISAADEVEGD